jgi:hypothetical protein
MEKPDNADYWWSLDEWRAKWHKGPLRSAKLPGHWEDTSSCNEWQSRDSMVWWSDGTSNQIVIGEKHIPTSRLGECVSGGDGSQVGDCSYMSSERLGTSASARTFFIGGLDYGGKSGFTFLNTTALFPLAKGNEFSEGAAWLSYGFGSAHPGVCNFMIGDGAVRGISNGTPVSPILMALGIVNDGMAVALP